MNRRSALGLALLGAAFFAPVAGRTQPIKLSLEGKLEEILRVLGQGIDYIVQKYDVSKKERVSKVAQHLTVLAGQEIELARRFRALGGAGGKLGIRFDDQDPRALTSLNELNELIAEIQATLARIKSLIGELSPEWARQNSHLNMQLAAFSHDGIIWELAPSGKLGVSLTYDQSLAFAAKLEREAKALIGFAQRINQVVSAGA